MNKAPHNSELAHGAGYTGFSSWTPEKGAPREVYKQREKFCLVLWGHIKLEQPQASAFQNATRPMVPDSPQQHSPNPTAAAPEPPLAAGGLVEFHVPEYQTIIFFYTIFCS